MKRAFADIALPARAEKPRASGLTMVLDKNLGLHGLQDLMDTAAGAVDLVKLGWGTSAVQDVELVRRKNALLAHHRVKVCPGGTLTELAWLQGQVSSFLEAALRLGFTCIEVSDGTVTMPHADKLTLIARARAAGFVVTSEVGAKQRDEDRRITLAERIRQAEAELDAGAWKVILEARESGTQGIFDASGATQHELVHALADRIGAAHLIFEAPQREQQTELILTLGADVNLGNVAPVDVVGLETLRLGLRSDTLRHFHADETAAAGAWQRGMRQRPTAGFPG
jgi:phosphosulfolactate synthase (CoM biosynthesis protein A)